MGIAFLDNMKSNKGFDINGVIEEYYVSAGENINAGDFVDFIKVKSKKDVYSYSTTVTSSATTINNGELACRITPIALSDEKIVVIFSHNGGSTFYLYGVVCNIINNVITPGAVTSLSSSVYSGSRISAVLLDDGRIAIAHTTGSSTGALRFTIISITGTTISVSSSVSGKAILNSSYSGSCISMTKLPGNYCFIAHSLSSSYNLYGIIVEINGDTIKSYTDTQLNAEARTAYVAMDSCLTTSNHIFIARSETSDSCLGATVCSYSGTTITVLYNSVIYNTANSNRNTKVVPLDFDKVFVTYCSDNTNYRLMGSVCRILSSKSLNIGTATTLDSTANSGGASANNSNRIISHLITSNTLFVGYKTTTSNALGIKICRITSGVITITSTKTLGPSALDSYGMGSCKLPNTNVFVGIGGSTSFTTHLWRADSDVTNIVPIWLANTTEGETKELLASLSESPISEGVARTGGEAGATNNSNLFLNDDFSSTINGWSTTTYASGYTTSNKILSLTMKSTQTSAKWIFMTNNTNNATETNHIYYYSCKFRKKGSTTSATGLFNSSNTKEIIPSNKWTLLSSRRTATTTTTDFYVYSTFAQNDVLEITEPLKYDLTAIFGSGNEPTQEWCDNNDILLEAVRKDKIKVYRPYSAYNLVSNGDFSGGLAGWVYSGSAFPYSVVTENGEKCLKIQETTSSSKTQNTVEYRDMKYQIDPSHIMYWRCYAKGSTSNTSTGYLRMHHWNADSGSPSTALSPTHNTWTLISGRGARATYYIAVQISYPGLNDECYFKDIRCYDLTELFGAGKEPTQEWCDANL